MEKHAIIVAGGSGSRMGGGLPKQFRMLAGRPLLWWALHAFAEEDKETILHLVLPEQYFQLWGEQQASLKDEDRLNVTLHAGGDSRTASVLSALSSIPSDDEILVAIHDAARPLISTAVISEGWEVAREHKAGVPVVPLTDSIRIIEGNGSRSVDRSGYVAVQTPQVFRSDILKDAYRAISGGSFTDDASVVEAYGISPRLFPGSVDNMKVTNPGDIEIAEVLIRRPIEER